MLELASSGAQVASTYTNARAKRGQAFYNATMAELEAQDTRNVGNSRAAKAGAQTDRNVGAVKTQIAGRGFTTGYGTANALQDATDFVGRLDALTIRENTQRAVIAKRAEAGGYRAQGDSISPGTEALGTLIGEAGTVARRWQK